MLISHFPGDSAFSSSLWPPPFSQLFPKVEVKFGKNMYKGGLTQVLKILKLLQKGTKWAYALLYFCLGLLCLFFFLIIKSDPGQPVSLRDHSKSGKVRGALAFLYLAKPVGFWPNPTTLERQQSISALEGLPAGCSIVEENALWGLWGREPSLVLDFGFHF